MRALLTLLLVLGGAEMALAGTVVSHETDRYYFRSGKMERYQGQFEITYDVNLEKGTVTRTRLYDLATKEIIPDDTVYQIEKNLLSAPDKNARYALPSVVRAVGRPDDDSVEILALEEKSVTTYATTADKAVLTYGRRLN